MTAQGAVIYCRVSTKEQVANMSLPTQLKACREYCRRQGYEVLEAFVEEGESAKTADRTELKRMLEFCRLNKRRVGTVVVYQLSRFARSRYDHVVVTYFLQQLGITLRSVTEPIDDSAVGKMMEGIISTIAEFDNNVKAERTRVGMKESMVRGRWPFVAPTGYLNGPDRRGVVMDPDRAALVRVAFEMMASGQHARADVLRHVVALGLTSRRGRRLSAQTFNSMLRNPLYAGRIRVRGFDVEATGAFEAIVPGDVFDQVQLVLDGRAGNTKPRRKLNPDFPLRQFVKCADCGKPLTGGRSTGRAQSYPYYHCYGCGRVRVRKEVLETAFIAELERMRPRPEFMKLFREVVLDAWHQRLEGAREMQDRLRARISTIEERMTALDETYIFRRGIDQPTYERHRDQLREELALANLELQDARVEELDIDAVIGYAEQLLVNAARMWTDASVAQKQRIQQAIFPQGLSFEGDCFRTAPTCLAFNALQAADPMNSSVASPTRLPVVDLTGPVAA